MSEKRTLIYARASLDLTGEGRSVERQIEASKALALARGWTVVGVEQDNSVSATSGKLRPAWRRVLAAIEGGKVDVVVAWHIDRMTRSMRDLEELIDLAEKHNVGIATATGDIDLTTDVGRMVARILAAVARAEVERKAARQKLAHEQMAAAGRPWTGGARPFGYTQDQTEIVPEEADALRWAADHLLLHDGTTSEVQREWQRRGFQRTLSGVRSALSSPRYIAVREHRGEAVGAAQWPAIFTEETHLALRAYFATPKRAKSASGSARKAQSLLSGLATCSRCGSGLTTTNRRGIRHYTCSSRAHCLTAKAELVEQRVVEELVGLLASDAVLSVLASAGGAGSMQAEADALRARLEVVGDNFIAGNLDQEAFAAMSGKLTAQVRKIEQQIRLASTGDALAGLDVGTAKVASQWNGLSLAKQRRLLGLLLRVVVSPANERRGGQNRWQPDRHIEIRLVTQEAPPSEEDEALAERP